MLAQGIGKVAPHLAEPQSSLTRMSVECHRWNKKWLHTDWTSRREQRRHMALRKTVPTDSLKSFMGEHVSWQ